MACAVRSSLVPLRLPDPIGVEMLRIRLQRAAVTIAECYRPPDDDAALEKITAALSTVQLSSRLVVVGDFNLPEIRWTATSVQPRGLCRGLPHASRVSLSHVTCYD